MLTKRWNATARCRTEVQRRRWVAMMNGTTTAHPGALVPMLIPPALMQSEAESRGLTPMLLQSEAGSRGLTPIYEGN